MAHPASHSLVPSAEVETVALSNSADGGRTVDLGTGGPLPSVEFALVVTNTALEGTKGQEKGQNNETRSF